MELSKLDLVSEDQAVSATAASTNVIKMADGQGPLLDGDLHFVIICTNTPADDNSGASTVQFKVQTSADNSSWTDVYSSAATALASFPADGVILDEPVPMAKLGKQYWRAYYTVAVASGKAITTAPKFTAGFCFGGAPRYVKGV